MGKHEKGKREKRVNIPYIAHEMLENFDIKDKNYRSKIVEIYENIYGKQRGYDKETAHEMAVTAERRLYSRFGNLQSLLDQASKYVPEQVATEEPSFTSGLSVPIPHNGNAHTPEPGESTSKEVIELSELVNKAHENIEMLSDQYTFSLNQLKSLDGLTPEQYSSVKVSIARVGQAYENGCRDISAILAPKLQQELETLEKALKDKLNEENELAAKIQARKMLIEIAEKHLKEA